MSSNQKLIAVRLDDSRFGSGPATVVAFPATVAEYNKLITDRDGARDPRMRLWTIGRSHGDIVIGSRVVAGLVPGTGQADIRPAEHDDDHLVTWEDLSPQERKHQVRWYSTKYGVTAAQAEQFARIVGIYDIELALDDWRAANGHPASSSPIVHGMVIDIIKGCHEPSRIRRGCK